MEVSVTRKDIKDAIAALERRTEQSGFSEICPLAQAIRRLGSFTESTHISVGTSKVSIYDRVYLNLSGGLPGPLLTPSGWSEALSSAPFTILVDGLENWL